MAAVSKRLATNVPGDVFVDEACIDCATCRWLAPATFDAAGEQSRVYRQPATEAERHRALMAVVACPVAAIGTVEKADLGPARTAFPDPIDQNVYHCGYHAEVSFGAASYLIVRPEGNVMIDSPRFAGPLVRRIEDMGGIAALFLTHRDDVADHQRFRDHFGCERVLHADDITRPTRGVERPIEGRDPVSLDDDLLVIPVPGHTRGSACLLYGERFLFTGDHLAWNPFERRLIAWKSVCWYDWAEQTASMERLAGHRFEWILPGHGRRGHLPADAMAAAVHDLAGRMRTL